mmetsp:Transcript_2863/g.3767  ORF Transcript_2863/g.3767 Transcript_2863/m.3767 type:complete len:90 (-) Transcript_2863:8-277(-)
MRRSGVVVDAKNDGRVIIEIAPFVEKLPRRRGVRVDNSYYGGDWRTRYDSVDGVCMGLLTRLPVRDFFWTTAGVVMTLLWLMVTLERWG